MEYIKNYIIGSQGPTGPTGPAGKSSLDYSQFGQYWSRNKSWQVLWSIPQQISTTKDGSYIIAGKYYSNDYGKTWRPTGYDSNYSAMSDSTKYQVISVLNNIYYSNDYGKTFNQTEQKESTYLTCTYDGSLMISASQYNLPYSTDYGKTWTPFPTTQMYCTTVALSKNTGKYIIYYTNQFKTYYLSTDRGKTWTDINSRFTLPVSVYIRNNICISDDGKYMAILFTSNSTNTIQISSDYGVTWTAVIVDSIQSSPYSYVVDWIQLSMDGSGKYLTAMSNVLGIFSSVNYGGSWFRSNITGTINPEVLRITPNAKYQYAMYQYPYIYKTVFMQSVIDMNGPKGSSGTSAINYSKFSTNWNINSNYKNNVTSNQIAISSSNSYITNGAYSSNDYGKTWTKTTLNNPSGYIAMSEDGKYQISTDINGVIYYSNDYGKTWLESSCKGASTYLSCTLDGSLMFATHGYSFLMSSDYGNAWSPVPSMGLLYPGPHAISTQTGRYVGIWQNEAVYYSNDYGFTMTNINDNLPFKPSANGFISISSYGKYWLLLCPKDTKNYLVLSNDYGLNWTLIDLSNNDWKQISISSTGQFMSAKSATTGIWSSTSYGAGWFQSNYNKALSTDYAITVSYDGTYQISYDNELNMIQSKIAN